MDWTRSLIAVLVLSLLTAAQVAALAPITLAPAIPVPKEATPPCHQQAPDDPAGDCESPIAVCASCVQAVIASGFAIAGQDHEDRSWRAESVPASRTERPELRPPTAS
jgi:hypothetical protein